MTGNPAMRPGDDHAIKSLLAKAEEDLAAESRAHSCAQCGLMAQLCEDYGRRLSAEMRLNARQRARLIALAGYGAAVTVALVAIWWAR